MDWLKFIHLLAIISWMAGLLYLPRLFVYHAENNDSKEISPLFNIMQHRLMVYIMRPAALVSWISGLWMAIRFGLFEQNWFLLKFGAVLMLTFCHGFFEMLHGKFRRGENLRSGKFYRIVNEIPTVIMIVIIYLVIFRPSV